MIAEQKKRDQRNIAIDPTQKESVEVKPRIVHSEKRKSRTEGESIEGGSPRQQPTEPPLTNDDRNIPEPAEK